MRNYKEEYKQLLEDEISYLKSMVESYISRHTVFASGIFLSDLEARLERLEQLKSGILTDD